MTQPEINVTPLIDVLLVLLIIFMVIAPSKPAHFAAQIPEKDLPSQHEPMPSVTIGITSDNRLSLNGQEMKEERLAAELARLMSERPSDTRNVFISGAASLSYQNVVRVIDLAKGAGAERQGLVLNELN